MGGIGSGQRWNYQAKDTPCDYDAIDIRRWQREGLLEPNMWFGSSSMWCGRGPSAMSASVETDQVIITSSRQCGKAAWTEIYTTIQLEWTPCTYGGQRAWFRCPAEGCGRRVAKLYYRRVPGYFACRHCLNLGYSSQRESPASRATGRAIQIRRRLGWSAGIIFPPGGKPKGMHWKTYRRLLVEYEGLVEIWSAGMEKLDNMLERRLESIQRELRRISLFQQRGAGQ